MPETTAGAFKKSLDAMVNRTIENHEVLRVRRKVGDDFVVIGEKDWRAIEECLYLNQFPGLVESIHEADREPIDGGTEFENLDR